MKTEKMFEFAVRNKLRFPFRGMISVEDLWDLSVTNLDKIFKELNSQVKQSKEESLLDTKTKEDEVLEIKIEIIKHIVSVKQEEMAAREKEIEKRAQKQKIMSIIAEKKDEALHNSSVEELTKMLEELN